MESTSSTVAMAAALAHGIELTGIAVMVLGGLLAIGSFLLGLTTSSSSSSPRSIADGVGPFDARYRALRANLGRAILLGLEFLVAADIIGTVAIEPSFRSLGVLALIVAMRTFLSFSLELEISGRWPWQHAAMATVATSDSSAIDTAGSRDARPPAG